MYRISVSLWFLLFWQFSFAFGMAGHPHNCNMIVDNVHHDIPMIKLKALSAITSDASTIEFLASYSLVHNMHCTHCDMAMVYSSRSDSLDGKCWYCSLQMPQVYFGGLVFQSCQAVHDDSCGSHVLVVNRCPAVYCLGRSRFV